MHFVNIQQAKTQLSRLLARAEAGEEVVIARRGKPVARLVGCQAENARRPDVMKGQAELPEDFIEPLPEDEPPAREDSKPGGILAALRRSPLVGAELDLERVGERF